MHIDTLLTAFIPEFLPFSAYSLGIEVKIKKDSDKGMNLLRVILFLALDGIYCTTKLRVPLQARRKLI